MDQLRCTACGTQSEAKCSCSKPYGFIKARAAATLALAVHPEWSDMRLAEATGVSDTTILRARKLTSSFEEVKSRIGRDGRTYAPRKSKAENSPAKQQQFMEIIRPLVMSDQPVNVTELAKEHGISRDTAERAYNSLKEAKAERDKVAQKLQVDPATLSMTAQQKLEAALRQHQRMLDAQFEVLVQGEIQRRVRELVMPALREQQEDAALVVRSRKGIFTEAEYNAILRCLHPDLHPSTEQKNEAFHLWHSRKVVLMSEKADPRQYKNLPSVDDFMAACKKSA